MMKKKNDTKSVENEKQSHNTPLSFTGIKIKKKPKSAVGKEALFSSLEHVKNYMKPTVATKTLFNLNQKGGFDCPGCAWPDPDDERSKLGEYCENGVKAIAEEATKKRLTLDFFLNNTIEEIGKKSDFELGKLGRLTQPLFLDKDSDNYEEITWDNAFKLIAKQLNKLPSPNDAFFYTSGRTSNEAAFLYQLFAREFGTNNLPDCSNMCHESSGVGLSQTVGIGKGSVTLKDIYKAEIVMVIGQNPGTNHPRMLTALEKCKENGGKIISVNPLPEIGLMKFTNPQRPIKMLTGGTALSDLFLQVKINGDIALLKAIILILLEQEELNPGSVFDLDFIKNKTNGYSKLIESLKKESLDDCIEKSGVDKYEILEAANLIKSKKRIIICWAMGITQHKNGVENVREIVNLLLLKGSIAKPGAGTCPVRGHSNVQGDRTMGIWEAPKDAFLDKLKETFGFEPPRDHGLAVVDAISAMKQEKGKVFIAMGGNFLSASPDTEFTAQALRNCSLTVHVSTKLNRSHLVHGDQALILPCLGRTEIDIQNENEQFVSVENSMGVVHKSKGILPPCSELLLSEPAIICEMAKATIGNKSKVDWSVMKSDYSKIRDGIEAVIPGFDNYNNRINIPEGFYLPNGARDGKFNTKSGKAEFTVNKVPKNEVEEGAFIMMTIRSHDQYNTTIYGLDDRYRGIYNERRVVLMNKKDIKKAGLKKGSIVNLNGTYNNVKRQAKRFIVIPYDIPRKCVATYFPEANVLVPIDSIAKGSKTPSSKWVEITIEKHDEARIRI